MRNRTSATLLAVVLSMGLAGCGQPQDTAPGTPAPPPEIAAPAEQAAAPGVPDNAARLAAILAAQPQDVQARYSQRHPAETLTFFGIEPGMTVAEVLPGGGWYSKILLPYLGEDGTLIGVDYALEMWPLFGFMTDEQLTAKETWPADWTATAQGWREPQDAAVEAFALGGMPEEMAGTADAVIMIRALHNMARFGSQGAFLDTALQDAFNLLKPGGIVGVVQHEARPEMPDDWASGDNGYLKRSFVIDRFEAAGFELSEESDINANPLDQPTTDEIVWRLPPNLRTSADDPELRAQLQAVGESNRMTLKFRKPE